MNSLIPSSSELIKLADSCNESRIIPKRDTLQWEEALDIAVRHCATHIEYEAYCGKYSSIFLGDSLIKLGYYKYILNEHEKNKAIQLFLVDLMRRFDNSGITATITDYNLYLSWEKPLKVYTNDYEWVIAYSPEDATAIMKEDSPDWINGEFGWEECPMDSIWTLDRQFTDSGEDECKTFAEWIAIKGRCFLGTSEY